MAIDGTTIFDQHTRRLFRCHHQCQKLPKSSWENFKLPILCTLATAWFVIFDSAATTAHEQIKIAPVVAPIKVIAGEQKSIPGVHRRLVQRLLSSSTCCVAQSQLEVQSTQTNNDAELGILRVRDLEVQIPQAESDLELGILRVRDLAVQSTQTEPDTELGTLRVRDLAVQSTQSEPDTELGILRVRDLAEKLPPQAADVELGTLRVRDLEVQPTLSESGTELGTLRVQDRQELQPPKLPVQSPRRPQPRAYLLAQVGYFQTNNVFSGVDPVDDGLFSSGLTFSAAPPLGPKTNLITAIDGSLIRYVEQSLSSYNQLRFRAGVRRRLTPRMYGEIGWTNQQLFRAAAGDRFLDENALRFAFYRRDPLTSKLRIDSFYELRLSSASPNIRSRIINALSVSLNYQIRRNLQIGLDYQFGMADFTKIDRNDEYHRLLTRLNYAVTRNSNISVQGGLTLGGSSNQNIDFDNFFFSFTYTLELGRF